MLPILQVGPLAIQVPGLMLLAGVWVVVSLTDREASRYSLKPSILSNMILMGLVVGILSARLWYAIRFFGIYLDNPLSVFSLNPTTLAPMEGALTGLAAAAYYGYRKGLRLWPTLDALTPGLAAFSLAVGFAHLASGDAFGAETAVPWAIELWGAQRHPTQIYEVIAAGFIFWLIWEMRRKTPASGFLFLAWVALAALSRLAIEAFRGDSIIAFDSLRSAQLGSLLVLAIALVGMHLVARAQAQDSRS
ncbi:MAG: prolipoprotein diacylglyceryl transferase family protein [Anaerolineales bacterium]